MLGCQDLFGSVWIFQGSIRAATKKHKQGDCYVIFYLRRRGGREKGRNELLQLLGSLLRFLDTHVQLPQLLLNLESMISLDHTILSCQIQRSLVPEVSACQS